MKNVIYLITLFLFFGCNPSSKISSKNEVEEEKGKWNVNNCEDLFAYIEKEWVKNESENCHPLNIDLVNQIKEYKDCFERMPRVKAEELFGVRPEQTISQLYYDVYKNCSSVEGKKLLYRIRFIMELGPNIKRIVGCQVTKSNQK